LFLQLINQQHKTLIFAKSLGRLGWEINMTKKLLMEAQWLEGANTYYYSTIVIGVHSHHINIYQLNSDKYNNLLCGAQSE